MIKVLFHSNQLGIRGTETALYEYAHYNETLLGNASYIAAPVYSDMQTYEKFKSRFEDRVLLYGNPNELQSNNFDVAYFIKAGYNDGKLIEGAKNIVHYVFEGSAPHGDIYVGVSEWLSKKYNTDYLPHIVTLPEVFYSYREYLGIAETDIVFGRHGGFDQFDVPYLKEVVEAAAATGIKFLFMNTSVFTIEHPNIMYLNPSYDLDTKSAFINTCDAMLHGRTEGETFGLSVCEFLYFNKPVITNLVCRDRNHIELLKDKGIYYTNANELYSILVNFIKKDYSVKNLIEPYSPEEVMKKFKKFLNV
jgi:hypothetical protein